MNIPSVCPILNLTHFPCPSCGITRAWTAAAQLDFAAAFGFHPMFWAVPLALVLLLIFRTKKSRLVWGVPLAAAFLAVYIVRVVWFGWRG